MSEPTTARDELAALIRANVSQVRGLGIEGEHEGWLWESDSGDPLPEAVADAILAAGWQAPELERVAVTLNATPQPGAEDIRCPECDRGPGQPCYELQRENLDGVRWSSFVVNFPPGQYHYARR